MAESGPDVSSTDVEEWAYKPLDTDTEELKEATKGSDLSLDVDVEIIGEFYDSTPCEFKFEKEGETITINNEQITLLRASVLKKIQEQNNEPRYCVQISTKINDDFVWFEIFFNTPADALKVCNICRKHLFSKGRCVDILCPKWTGKLNIGVSDVGEENPEAEMEEYTIILDDEGLFLFRDFNKRVPDFFLHFYKESADNSLEKALIQHLSNTIILQSMTKKFVIHNASDIRSFPDALKSIKPKPKDIFQDHSRIVKYYSSIDKPAPALTGPFISRHAVSRTTHEDWQEGPFISRHAVSRTTHEDWQEEGASYQRVNELEPARVQTNIISRNLDEAEAKLSGEDDVSLPWVIAEDEIRQMLQNEEAFDSSQKDMLSGGLDPNSPDHLMKCLTEIEEFLMNQRYDLALSRLKGTKTIFTESDVAEITRLINTDYIVLLRKLYYHSYSQN